MKYEMCVEFTYDQKKYNSIKTYCLLRSLLKIDQEDEKQRCEKHAFSLLSYHFQVDSFRSRRHRDALFNEEYKNIGNHQYHLAVYQEIEKALQHTED